MPQTYEHVRSEIPAKINTYVLTRAELLITLCYEIPCMIDHTAILQNVADVRSDVLSQLLEICVAPTTPILV